MSYDGHGLGITFSGGFSANIIDAKGPDVERPMIETSHLKTEGGFKTYTGAKLVEGGEIGLTIEYDGSAEPPLDNDDAETVTFAHDDAADIGISFPGFFSKFSSKFANGERITADVSVKVAGAITGL